LKRTVPEDAAPKSIDINFNQWYNKYN
jgi:hypothetical protein